MGRRGGKGQGLPRPTVAAVDAGSLAPGLSADPELCGGLPGPLGQTREAPAPQVCRSPTWLPTLNL